MQGPISFIFYKRRLLLGKKDKVDMERGVGKKKQEPPVFWSSFLFGLVRLVDFSSQAHSTTTLLLQPKLWGMKKNGFHFRAWSLFAPSSAKPYFAIALFQNRPKIWFCLFALFQKRPKMWFFMFTLFQKCPKIWFYMIALIMVCPHFFAQFLSLRNLIFSVMVCPKAKGFPNFVDGTP